MLNCLLLDYLKHDTNCIFNLVIYHIMQLFNVFFLQALSGILTLLLNNFCGQL